MKCTFDFSYIFGCELIAGPKASKSTKEPVASCNLIRKRIGCDEYVENQLNVASKNFAGKRNASWPDDPRSATCRAA